MLAVIGKKLGQTQKFLVNGTRIPVTIVATPGNTVTEVRTQDKHGYTAVQLGFGMRKNANKPQTGHAKKAQLEKAPVFLAEARMIDKDTLPALGDKIAVETVLSAGDIVDVTGKSKGKGFAGGVKRYQFKGGPKTHGQSDRHRAPGSIGSGTTPGRVYKGKRMAGKMGNDQTTLKNLEVVKVGTDFVWVKGVVPGNVGAVVVIRSTGKKNKKFVEPMKTEEELRGEAEAAEKARLEAEKQAVEAAKAAEEEAKKAAEETIKEEVKTEEKPAEESKQEEKTEDKKEEAK